MTSKALTVIAVVLGLPGFAGGAAHAQQPDPAESVVLVANIISSTHARLTTGVVLARQDEADQTLLVVGASFVSRGDEILVLDGGTDLMTDGRPTRTVARSVEAGIAVLEVDALNREGMGVAERTGGESKQLGPQRFEFLAWPAARELAGSASIIRQAVEINTSEAGEVMEPLPDLPANAGVLVDGCGQLAGLVAEGSGESDPTISSAASITDVLRSAGLKFVSGACPHSSSEAEKSLRVEESAASVEAGPQVGEEAEKSDSSIPIDVASGPDESSSSNIGTVVYRVIGFVIFGLILIAFIAERRRPAAGLNLDLLGERNEKIRVRYGITSGTLQHPGTTVSLEREGDAVVVSRRDRASDVPQVMLSGTAFLEDEVLLAGEGDTITVGGTAYRIQFN